MKKVGKKLSLMSKKKLLPKFGVSPLALFKDIEYFRKKLARALKIPAVLLGPAIAPSNDRHHAGEIRRIPPPRGGIYYVDVGNVEPDYVARYMKRLAASLKPPPPVLYPKRALLTERYIPHTFINGYGDKVWIDKFGTAIHTEYKKDDKGNLRPGYMYAPYVIAGPDVGLIDQQNGEINLPKEPIPFNKDIWLPNYGQ